MRNRNRPKPKREPPKRFAWFFGYHVFDVEAARRLAAEKPVSTLTTVSAAALLDDGAADLDLVPCADVNAVAILARVPIGNGLERYLLIDGYETVKRCVELGKNPRLRILSCREAYRCRLPESLGEWPEQT